MIVGFDSHAKLAHNKSFTEFGSTYKRGDTIGCFLDLTDPEKITLGNWSKPIRKISFSIERELFYQFKKAYTRNGKQQLTDDGEETITLDRNELGIQENR